MNDVNVQDGNLAASAAFSEENARLQPHLARLTSIVGVVGALVMDEMGVVQGSAVPEKFRASLDVAVGFLNDGILKLSSLGHKESFQLIRFQKYTVLTKLLNKRPIVLFLEHDTNPNLLRVGMHVFKVKLKHDAAAPLQPLQLGVGKPVNVPGLKTSAKPKASVDVVGVDVIAALRKSLEVHTKNAKAGAFVTRVLASMKSVDETLLRRDYPRVIDILARMLRQPLPRTTFIHECYDALLKGEMAKKDALMEGLRQQVALFGEGLGICAQIVTPTIGVDEERDEGKIVERLGVLMEELSVLGVAQDTNTDLLNLGDRLLSVQEELLYAGQLQRSLVPPSGELKHTAATIAACFRPTAHCGGDWWSMRSCSDKRLIIVIADVTGHGTPAAILTGVLKGTWDQIPAGETSPSAMLKTLNEAIYRIYRRKMMATCAISIVDVETMEFTIASAGHNFPYLVRKSGAPNTLYSLLARGNALGASASPEYEETVVALEPEDLIFWYTDGAIECMNPQGEQFGDKRLRRYLARTPINNGPVSVRDNLLRELSSFCGERALEDDLTLVVGSIGGSRCNDLPRNDLPKCH